MKLFCGKASVFALLLSAVSTVLGQTDDRLLDIGFVVDTSGSFSDDVAAFQVSANLIVSELQALFPNVQFGMATFEDYPFNGWGGFGDLPHRLVKQLGPADDTFFDAVNNLAIRNGGDGPESQLVSLYQSLTGEGQTVEAEGFTIDPDMGFNFRSGSSRVIVYWTDALFHTPENTPGYPGPSVAEVVSAALNLDTLVVPGFSRRRLQNTLPSASSARIVGIASTADPVVLQEIAELANKTGAVAGAGGVDCDDDGIIDIQAGEPIICNSAVGVSQAVLKVVEAIVPEIPVANADDDGHTHGGVFGFLSGK